MADMHGGVCGKEEMEAVEGSCRADSLVGDAMHRRLRFDRKAYDGYVAEIESYDV